MKIKSFVQDIRNKHKEAIKWSASILIFVAIFFIGSCYHQLFGYKIVLPNLSFAWFTNINFSWIKDYQTLITGSFAAIAAYFAWKQLQINQEESRNARIARCWEIINNSRGEEGNRGQKEAFTMLFKDKAETSDANFSKIDFSNYTAKNIKLINADFSDCRLSNTVFEKCYIHECIFGGTITNMWFKECQIDVLRIHNIYEHNSINFYKCNIRQIIIECVGNNYVCLNFEHSHVYCISADMSTSRHIEVTIDSDSTISNCISDTMNNCTYKIYTINNETRFQELIRTIYNNNDCDYAL